MISIRLTAAQASIADWAIGGMESMSDDDYEEFGYTPNDLPRLEGTTLIFPTGSVAAYEDMLYRVTEQINDMADQEGYFGPSGRRPSTAAADNLAEKLRDAFTHRTQNPVRSTFLRF